MNNNRDNIHLLIIRDAIEKIEDYAKGIEFDEFAKRERDFDAILMQIIVIGELVNTLSEEFKERHHTLLWHQAVGLRNQIAHGYIDIKPEIVWQTIRNDLPILKKDLLKLISSS